MRIYYDSYQEGMWFKELHQVLEVATLYPFPGNSEGDGLVDVLEYDRPDIVLTDDVDRPLMVVERTIEVPSGHNVGQRFARLAAAAEANVPTVYFGPYAAFKHGGETQGPRYMNLRLFYAIDEMMHVTGTPVTTVRWPVDDHYEIIRDASKDERMRAYMEVFFTLLSSYPLEEVAQRIRNSDFEREQEEERQRFIEDEVQRPEQYDDPPGSVSVGPNEQLPELSDYGKSLPHSESVLYKVGMTYMRSDPYTGMGILYSYLYCGGLHARNRNLIFHFFKLNQEDWREMANRSPDSKTIRLFKLADGVLFKDGLLPRENL